MSFLFVVNSFSCDNSQKEAIINGQIDNISASTIYLVDAYDWQKKLDSAQCIDGRFSFNYKIKPGSEPFLASLYFLHNDKPIMLVYNNYILSPSTSKYSISAFMLEATTYKISGKVFLGDFSKKTKHVDFLELVAGKETDALYETQMMNFGYLGNDKNDTSRASKILHFKSIIDKYKSSIYLLSQIFANKEQYSNEELEDILKSFNVSLNDSQVGRKLKTYIANRPIYAKSYSKVSLIDENGNLGLIINKKAKVNMIVFWASWCGPCRMEIPEIKKINERYKDKGLYIASVSIDKNLNDWTTALAQEKMSWMQFLAKGEQIDEIKDIFGFSAIPTTVFADRNGIEIQRFTGFKNSQTKEYTELLNKLLE